LDADENTGWEGATACVAAQPGGGPTELLLAKVTGEFPVSAFDCGRMDTNTACVVVQCNAIRRRYVEGRKDGAVARYGSPFGASTS
jgi:hypothetical protein